MFLVDPNKSIFVPARSIEYLGFVNNSQSVIISLTKKNIFHKTVMSRIASGRISYY